MRRLVKHTSTEGKTPERVSEEAFHAARKFLKRPHSVKHRRHLTSSK